MAFSSSQTQGYLPEGHSPHHNLRDIYLNGILITSEMFTWRAFSSSQPQEYLPEGHSHHNFKDIYLNDIITSGMFPWMTSPSSQTSGVFTWRAFSSLQGCSPEWLLPITNFRGIYLKDILITSGMFTWRTISSSQLQIYLPEVHSHHFRDVYLNDFSPSQLQGYLPEVHSPHHNFRDSYLNDILITSDMFTWRTFSLSQTSGIFTWSSFS